MHRGDRFIDLARDALARRDLAAAERALRAALCCAPDRVEGHFNLGVLQGRTANPGAAIRCYRRALIGQPGHPAAAGNLADALLSLSRDDEAERVCVQALDHDPLAAGLLGNLALIRVRRGDHRRAEQDVRRAVCVDPSRGKVWQTLGMLHHDRADSADSAYRRAWFSGTREAGILVNQGEIAQREGRIPEAIVYYKAALGIAPQDPGIQANLAAAKVDAGDFPAARAAARAVLVNHPDHRLARWIDSWVSLAHRDFASGYRAYDDPWQRPDRDAHPYTTQFPLWDRTPLAGPLLLWCDQGLGDEILYAGMIDDVLALGVHVMLETDARLVPLFQRSWPTIEIIARGDVLPTGIVAQSSVRRLPMLFRRGPGDFPPRRSYLVADPERVSGYRAIFRRAGAGRGVGAGTDQSAGADKSVGLSWRSGNPRTGSGKSTTLAAWDDLLGLAGARFFSLQYDDGGAADPRLQPNPGPSVKADIDGLAAQIAALDHVVSISGVTAHLAGALGVPGHVLLPSAPLWFWFAEGSDCPWYPSLSVVRRALGEDWTPVVRRAGHAVRPQLTI
jgi:Tfp pilus assembly protein PilF